VLHIVTSLNFLIFTCTVRTISSQRQGSKDVRQYWLNYFFPPLQSYMKPMWTELVPFYRISSAHDFASAVNFFFFQQNFA